MIMMGIALVVKRIEINLPKTCNETSMTCEVPMVEVFRHCSLFEIRLPGIMRINQCCSFYARYILKTKSHLLRKLWS